MIEEEYPELASDATQAVGAKTVKHTFFVVCSYWLSKKLPGSLHRKRMFSLANAYNQEDILAFFHRIKVQLKEDKVLLLLKENFKYQLSVDRWRIFPSLLENFLLTDKIGFLLELKYDGVAINLQYVKGKLDKALTRGDGVKGEDCTYAIKKYANDNWIKNQWNSLSKFPMVIN